MNAKHFHAACQPRQPASEKHDSPSDVRNREAGVSRGAARTSGNADSEAKRRTPQRKRQHRRRDKRDEKSDMRAELRQPPERRRRGHRRRLQEACAGLAERSTEGLLNQQYG